MLCKLAVGNVRRAGRDYLVYLLTLSLAVTVFYAFNTISMQTDIAGVSNKGVGQLMGNLIGGLTVFLGAVMGFLMVYANNFIMKRRKKEFGLYQVLGMSRGQVARIMTLETAVVSGMALVLGLLAGIALSWLMTFFTASMFKTQVANFRFFVSPGAMLMTVSCLLAIFLVSLVFNLRVVARAKVIDLMSAGRVNEAIKTRNPWLSAIVFVAGAVLVGVSYARLLHDGLPVMLDDPNATTTFGITTAMVVVGTVLLFFGLSGFLLRALQTMRGLYWRGLNMFTLRQLAAKVNTVSASMAVIAMVLFLAMISVTSGMAMASWLSDSIAASTPADYSRTLYYYTQQQVDYLRASSANAHGDDYAAPAEPVDMQAAMRATDVGPDGQPFDMARVCDAIVQVNTYASYGRGETADSAALTIQKLADAAGTKAPEALRALGDPDMLAVMGESDYNAYRALRGLEPIDLGQDGYLITSDVGGSLKEAYDAAMSKGVTIELGGRTLRPAAGAVDRSASAIADAPNSNTGTVVVPDAVIRDAGLTPLMSYLLANYRDDVSAADAETYMTTRRIYGGVVTDALGREVGSWGAEATSAVIIDSFNNTNALISFLAIYIGFVLVVACGAILAIQQLSGVADASRNYRVLSELGTPTRQIRRSMLAQQAVFFCFPLVVGFAHSLVALSVVIDLVLLLGGFSIGATTGLAVAIFVVAYGGYFLLTYLMSSTILRDAIRSRHRA